MAQLCQYVALQLCGVVKLPFRGLLALESSINVVRRSDLARRLWGLPRTWGTSILLVLLWRGKCRSTPARLGWLVSRIGTLEEASG